jgi:hypothetical protein
MLRILVLVCAVAATAGCVSVQHLPMDAASADSMKGKEMVLAERPRPDFAAMTPTKAMFGAIGGAAMVGEGNDIVKANAVQDPAIYIGESLAEALGTRYSIRRSPKGVPVVTDETADLAKVGAASDLALDVRTINWSMAYYPTSWGKYRVIYSARLRLLDTKSGKVLAEGGCARVPDEIATAPSYDELLANNAERLKQELRTAAEFCVNEFRTKTLAL